VRLGIPRAAVLSDQQGDYVYVVDAQNRAEIRRIQLGQSTPTTAVVTNGLKEDPHASGGRIRVISSQQHLINTSSGRNEV
jgi:hypothetical protein